MQAADTIFALMGDKAQQIMIEGTGDETDGVNQELVSMKASLGGLKRNVERQMKQCEKIQKNRESFETSVEDAIGWLEDKESHIATCGPLDLNPEKVNIAYQKHQVSKSTVSYCFSH